MKPFLFMTSVEAVQLTGRKAGSLLELYLCLKEVEASSLYHHTHRFYRDHSFLGPWDRSDFALWASQNLKEEEAGERMGSLDARDYRTLEDLRGALLACLEPLMVDKQRWIRRVPPGLEFHFCKAVSLVLPTGRSARNLEGFLDALEGVDTSCLYHHLIEAPLHYHGEERPLANDFSRWLADSGFPEQARAVAAIDPYHRDLESLREDLLSVFRKDHLKALVRRVLDRAGRHSEGDAAARWLQRWRKGD